MDNAAASPARLLPKKIVSASFPNGSEAGKGNKADIQEQWSCWHFKLFESFVLFRERHSLNIFLNKLREKVAFQKVLSDTMRSFTRRARTPRPSRRGASGLLLLPGRGLRKKVQR